MGRLQLLDRTRNIQACLDLEADLPWGRDVFYKTGLETTRTSPKPVTDKPYQIPTSRTEKQTDWRNIQEPLTSLEVGIVTTVFDEFLGKKRVKCGALNKFLYLVKAEYFDPIT